MSKVIDTLKAIRSPKTNTPLAVLAVLITAALTAFGVIVDPGTIAQVLFVVVPLAAGALQWNTKQLTESVDATPAVAEEVAPTEETPVVEEVAPVDETVVVAPEPVVAEDNAKA